MHQCLFRAGLLALCGCATAVFAAPPRPFELADIFRFHRVSDPHVSPDGKSVAYVVTDPSLAENRTNSDVWLVSLAGGAPRALTNSPQQDRNPRWSPDGKWIAFESTRSGANQIWLLPVTGGEARQLTTLSTEASTPVWSPDGKSLAFVSAVFPEFSDKPFTESEKLNREKLDARAASKVKARLFTQLLYRHWDSWVEGLRQHIFVVGVNADGSAAGDPRDVTPGENDGVPTSSTFSAGEEFAFSPDGREIVFTAPPLPTRTQAWSTNHDLWAVNLATGERRQVTTNPAADGEPRFSPDGKYLAYRAQTRPGFEADRWQLMLLDRASGKARSLTADFDAVVGTLCWAPDSRTLYFDTEEKGMTAVYRVTLAADGSATQPECVLLGASESDEQVTPDGRALVFSRSRFNQPPEVYSLALDAKADVAPQAITHTNDALLAPIELRETESVTVAGAGGTPVQMFVIKPPGFDPAKKYPLVFMVHGGPQVPWSDGWSTRWNPELWAAQGYVLALPNPRGSPGFGQTFTDEISGDWGGKAYDDLMACLEWLKKQPYVDATRMAAAGASYGGYMMNWINGHTDQFRCIVNHDGVFNFWSMYGTTEEIWFDEWEHGVPWETPDFDKFSPHKYAANFKTPTLIIHNELDFRVPVGEGQQLFTLLQRKGVPSKFLSFPDEGHWVLKPKNSELWHQTVFDWLAAYLKH